MFDSAPLVDRIERFVRQGLGQRAHGTSVLGAVGHQDRDFFEARGDGLLDAAVARVDDISVAAAGLSRNDGRLDDADGFDRRKQQRIGLRI